MIPGSSDDQTFFWGVATSAYQAEGGYNGDGEPQTNWARVERSGEVQRLGKAAEFWTRFREDFRLCRSLGLNAFRLGLEWSRIQPGYEVERTYPPPFDFSALDHYVEMLASCRAAGLEPIVTLHHFVHPAWLGSDPWLEESTADHFAGYAETCLLYVNGHLLGRHATKPLRYFITINEPNMLVINTYLANQFPRQARAGLDHVARAYGNLLRAHVLAYHRIHNLYEEAGWPRPAVSLNNYCSDLYWLDKFGLDLLALRARKINRAEVGAYVVRNSLHFEEARAGAGLPLRKNLPFLAGTAFKRTVESLVRHFFHPGWFEQVLEAIYSSPRAELLDFLGLDYYDPFLAHVFRLPVWSDHEFRNKSAREWMMNSVTSKWWDWRVLPRGLHFFCEYYHREFKLPVLIAENGMAIRRRHGQRADRRRDRMTRSQFIRLHVNEVNRIRREGVPMLGYLHWSLFDNYEWGTYTPRFGLYSISYEHGTDRHALDEAGDCPSATYAKLIAGAQT